MLKLRQNRETVLSNTVLSSPKSAFRRCRGTAWKRVLLSPVYEVSVVTKSHLNVIHCQTRTRIPSNSLRDIYLISPPDDALPPVAGGFKRPLGSAVRVGCEYLEGQLAVPGFLCKIFCLSVHRYNSVLSFFSKFLFLLLAAARCSSLNKALLCSKTYC